MCQWEVHERYREAKYSDGGPSLSYTLGTGEWGVRGRSFPHNHFRAKISSGQSVRYQATKFLDPSAILFFFLCTLPHSYTTASLDSPWVSPLLKSKQTSHPSLCEKSLSNKILHSRTRISNDPQNITWAKDTSRFGHKILTSQGWTPGSTLGAANAAHAAHYTAASTSHIRVALKDDNLGLGAKRGSENADNFGLAGLASILGRLNGNEADVKKEEERMEKVEQRAYVYRKYGLMNFVSGGFLVGGEMKPKSEIQVKKEITIKEEPDSETDDTKSKKRKRSRDIKEEPEDSDEEEEEPTLKRKKKSMNLRDAADAEEKSKKSKKDKKDKKEKKDKKSSSTSSKSSSAVDTPAPVSTTAEEEPTSDKARRKAEKRARKEEKKLKKALKKAAKEAAQSKSTNPADSSSESEDDDEESTPTSSIPTSGVSTPASGASGLSFNVGGRHAVRQRYIRQKKMAGMDPQALKEVRERASFWIPSRKKISYTVLTHVLQIFMIKTPS